MRKYDEVFDEMEYPDASDMDDEVYDPITYSDARGYMTQDISFQDVIDAFTEADISNGWAMLDAFDSEAVSGHFSSDIGDVGESDGDVGDGDDGGDD